MKTIKFPSNVNVKKTLLGLYFPFINWWNKEIFRSKPHLERFNPLNTELNPICHLLILLGDLTFMGKCIVSISNKMQRYTVYLYLETALHVSGGTSTHR
jgi:hypothetical protein